MMSLSRRLFLSAAGASAFPNAAIATPAPRAAPPPAPAENPALLALDQELTRALAALDAAEEAWRAARRHAESLWPEAPPDLVAKGNDPFGLFLCAVRETDVEGRYLSRDHRPARFIVPAHSLRMDLTDFGTGPRTKRAREIRKLLRLAEPFEAAMAAAKEASGIEAARDACDRVAERVHGIAGTIGKAKALTREGLAIKAKAIVAAGRLGIARNINIMTLYSADLAESVLRMAGSHVA